MQLAASLRIIVAAGKANALQRRLSRRGRAAPAASPAEAGAGFDQAVTAIYGKQYGVLVRQAVLLLGDVAAAEAVVQESFVALRGSWQRLRDEDEAASYLRRSVVSRSRSVLRHGMANRRFPALPPDTASFGDDGPQYVETLMIIAAMSLITPRQREALVLKYYLDLPEAEIASTMGISRGAVRSHIARAMDSLRTASERHTGGAAGSTMRG